MRMNEYERLRLPHAADPDSTTKVLLKFVPLEIAWLILSMVKELEEDQQSIAERFLVWRRKIWRINDALRSMRHNIVTGAFVNNWDVYSRVYGSIDYITWANVYFNECVGISYGTTSRARAKAGRKCALVRRWSDKEMLRKVALNLLFDENRSHAKEIFDYLRDEDFTFAREKFKILHAHFVRIIEELYVGSSRFQHSKPEGGRCI